MIGSIDKKQLNSIFWSPKGRFAAFANLGRGITQNDFEIYDCDYEGDNKDFNKELNANIMPPQVLSGNIMSPPPFNPPSIFFFFLIVLESV
jgi:hypothetical protein